MAASDRLDCFTDFLNQGSDNRGAVFGVVKLQVHATADVSHLEHGTAPGRSLRLPPEPAADSIADGLRSALNPRLKLCPVGVVLSSNLEHGVRRQTLKEHASLDFRLHDASIHIVAQVGVRRKHNSLYHSLYRGWAYCHNTNLYRWEVLCPHYLGERAAALRTGFVPYRFAERLCV